jgi:hypothetical protein
MQRAARLESNRRAGDREAATAASRSTPLQIVSGAVAGDDLQRVAVAASEALGRPVAIAMPAAGANVAHPPESIAPERMHEITQYAVAAVRGDAPGGNPPPPAADVVPIRIGLEVVGVVAAAPAPNGAAGHPGPDDSRAWLEAAATAAAVTTLMREARAGSSVEARRALLRALSIGPPAEVTALVGQARRLGFDLSAGAVAICARAADDADPAELERLATSHAALLAGLGGGRVLGLAPSGDQDERPAQLAAQLRARGMRVALSARRRAPETLHDAVREAELLLELSEVAGAALSGQEETYRLLIGVLLRNPEELASLRAGTISPLAAYDAEHDTDLLATLETFLAHHGSTTETAEAMNLHRHTVGYRLSRVHEVSRLSPYESDGRERLSLGLKAHQILEAAGRRAEHP